MTPLLSIAMPFYNCRSTLAASIQSIIDQTFGQWELLLYDDASTDGSYEVAASFVDPRIVLLRGTNRIHLAAGLNRCIRQARGKYLGRMDGDDISYPERFEIQLKFILENPEVDLISCEGLVFGPNGISVGKLWWTGTDHASLTHYPLVCIPMIHVGWLGKTSWFLENRYDERALIVQDQELLFRAYKHSQFAVVPEVLVGIRFDRIDLRKMLRRRIAWMKYMSWHHQGLAGVPALAIVSAVLCVKAVIDLFAIISHLNYRVLRHRARPISPADAEKWDSVWARNSGTVEELALNPRSIVQAEGSVPCGRT